MESITLKQAAELVGGRVAGDGEVELTGVAPLDEAGPTELGLVADRRYLQRAADSRAGAFLVSESLEDALPAPRDRVVVEDAHAALVPLLHRLHPEPVSHPGVHPTAVLGRDVELGVGVTVGPYAVVESGCVLEDRCRIGPHTVVGRGCRVGEDATLHAQVTLYPGTVVGRRTIVHSGARLGVDGFGYAPVDGVFHKIPQVGRCVIEDDVEIGANTCVDRGSIGETRIGRGTKLDNLVHLAHNVRVGPGCAMAAQVGIAGSTRIGSGVVFGGQAGLAGHLEVGDGSRISAQAGVIGDVAKGDTVTGYPARDLKIYLRASAHFLRLPELAKRVADLERRAEEPQEDGKKAEDT
ncbi:MAG TPA: UDP-3-O-(3-hydroxymyristoyl)glucosamine N-acyltransferase [Longimicrobiales bacterium]|nr:UDP-3-O-(3-hydroxymyristoyl)glucosamine N-acyltransferase [Longimicrobiales bacterium]